MPHDGVKAPERMGKGGQESNIGLGGRFLGEGEHQRRYRAHDVSAVKADTKAGKPKGGQGVFGGPGARFDGQTTYGDGSGLGHDVSLDPEDGGEKAPARRELHAPFDGTTEYGSRYPQHPVELQEKMKTATGTGIPGLGEGKLKGHTEARAAFTPKKVCDRGGGEPGGMVWEEGKPGHRMSYLGVCMVLCALAVRDVVCAVWSCGSLVAGSAPRIEAPCAVRAEHHPHPRPDDGGGSLPGRGRGSAGAHPSSGRVQADVSSGHERLVTGGSWLVACSSHRSHVLT